MSFFRKVVDRLRGRAAESPADAGVAAPREPVAPAVAAPDPVEAGPTDEVATFAGRIGEDGGPTTAEILAWMRGLRGTVAEGALVRALGEAAPRAPEVVRVAAAELLASRGEEARALELLDGVGSAAGLMLQADLLAAAGNVAAAVASVERVLARDLDEPGARERHARWREALGLGARRGGRLDEVTVLRAEAAQTPFQLVREVARGGAGTVYEAVDEVLGRKIAFKVHHARGADRGVLSREVLASTELAGPGVVRLYDASPADGWLALEWVPAGSIRDILRTDAARERLGDGAWIEPLVRALARLHGRGWVHGDVKPANVLLRSARDPVLGDLGLSRRQGAAPVGGSPGYVSPERLGGQPVDPRDDVYGLGRVLEDCTSVLGEGWSDVVRACLAPAARRPPDATALLAAIAARGATRRSP